jgi:hypothetical protein
MGAPLATVEMMMYTPSKAALDVFTGLAETFRGRRPALARSASPGYVASRSAW